MIRLQKNIENIPKIIGEENEAKWNKVEKENNTTATPSQGNTDKERDEKGNIPKEKFSFFLVLNSDQINSKIFVDGKPAKIISGQNTTYPEIEINKLTKEYSIQLTNDKIQLRNITKYIFKSSKSLSMQLKFACLFLLAISNNILIAQNNLCQNIYIWDFKTADNERNFVTNTLSNEIEDVLTQISSCKILQRRKYADIQKQIDNEIQISNVEGISSNLKNQLRTIQAERVLFGEVEQDFSFNVNLRLRLEHLSTKQIKTTSILIEAEKMINPPLRTQVLQNALNTLLGINDSNGNIINNHSKDEIEHLDVKGSKGRYNYSALGRIKPLPPKGTTGTSTYGGGYRPYAAVDQNPNSYYVSQSGKLIGEELTFLYDQPIEIHKLEFYAPDNPDGASVKEAILYFSDGSSERIFLNWQDNYSVVQLSNPSQTDELRLVINDVTDNTKSYVAIYELKIFGRELNIPKSNKIYSLVKPQSAQASSSYSEAYSPKNSYDGITTNYWCSTANRIKDESIKYIFSSSESISKIKIFRPLNSDGLSIKKAKLYYDDNSYQTIEFRGLYGWEELEIKPVKSKFIEIVVEDTFSLLGGSYVSLYEIQFFQLLK